MSKLAWNSNTSILLKQVFEKPILPLKNCKNVLITSALPYVNNTPHLGNIIGSVLSGDVFARYSRARGHRTIYICGTDEYGTCTETAALKAKLTPREICDKYYKIHADIYKWFNIDFDHFGRTTCPQQKPIAYDIFNKLDENGFISRKTVQQLYCTECSKFLADRWVEGECYLCHYPDARGDQCDKCCHLMNAIKLINPTCKVCKSEPCIKSSDHLFVDLDKLQPKLENFLTSRNMQDNWTENAVAITKSWLKEKLHSRCITRDLKWGTPVPKEGFTDKVFYVWFDAPIGYMSATAEYTKEWEKWWKNPEEVDYYQFLGKDNVPFHAVMFPCSLLGTKDNWTYVKSICATEYLNYEDGKFSKSREIGVFGDQAKNTTIDSDIWRYYLLAIRPECHDSTFSWDDLVAKNNNDLLKNLGNFIHRSCTFMYSHFKGTMSDITHSDEILTLMTLVDEQTIKYVYYMDKTLFREAVKCIFNISRLGNQFIQSHQPWQLIKVKDGGKSECLALEVCSLCVNISVHISILLSPFMPVTGGKIRNFLNCPDFLLTEPFGLKEYLKKGHVIGKPGVLIKRVEQEYVDKMKVQFSEKKSTNESITKFNKKEVENQISIQAEHVRCLKLALKEEVEKLLVLKEKLKIST